MALYERCPGSIQAFRGPGPEGWDAVYFSPLDDEAVVVGMASGDEALLLHMERGVPGLDDPTLMEALTIGDARDRRAAEAWMAVEDEAARLVTAWDMLPDEALEDSLDRTAPATRDEALAGWVRVALEYGLWRFQPEAMVAARIGGRYGAAEALARARGVAITEMPVFGEILETAVSKALAFLGIEC